LASPLFRPHPNEYNENLKLFKTLMFKATNKKQRVLFGSKHIYVPRVMQVDKSTQYEVGLPGKLGACPTAS